MDLFGIYPAIVCDIKDPQKRGRVKVTCADVFGDVDVSSGWCDPCVPGGIDGGGSIRIPSIDEGVWIMFNGGDVDKPVYLGGWWSENSTPFLSDYPSEPNSTWVTTFKDNVITLKEEECTIENNNAIISIKDGGITIEGDITITGNITVEGDITTNGAITTDTATFSSATIDGKAFSSHTHMGVNGETSAPL